jgi:hypothetical protein
MVKSLFLLILVWLAFQFGALLLDGPSSRGMAQKSGAPSLEATLRDWPTSSQAVAKDVIHRLGPPDVIKQDLLRWDRRGVGLVLYRDKTEHGKRRAIQTAEAVQR